MAGFPSPYNTPIGSKVYRPSLGCAIRILFDEALTQKPLPPPKTPEDIAAECKGGIKIQVDKLTSPTGQVQQATIQQPDLRATSGNNPIKDPLIVFPKRAEVGLNGFRQSATFNLTFDFRVFPCDVRLLRGSVVEIYLGAIPSQDFSAGMLGGTRNGSRVSKLTTTDMRDPFGHPNVNNLLIAGVVDRCLNTHSGSMSEVLLEGRDYSGALQETKMPFQVFDNLDLTRPINEVVAQVLGHHPLYGHIIVQVFTDDWPDGVRAPASDKTAARQLLRANGKSKPMHRPQGEPGGSISFWDTIVRFCLLVGAVPFFVGEILTIRPGRGLFQQDVAKFSPFEGHQRTIDGRTFYIREFYYGDSVEELKFERKVNGQVPGTVRCVGYDQGSVARGMARRIEATWPALDPVQAKAQKRRVTTGRNLAAASKVSASGHAAQEDIINIPIGDVKDFDELQRIAKDIYEEIGRGELGGSCSTRSLASFGGSNSQDPDLLHLRPGDAVRIRITPAQQAQIMPVTAELIKKEGTQEAALIKLLTDMTGNVEYAIAHAKAQGNLKAMGLDNYRVQNVHYSWDANSGVSINFDFQNFILVRSDVTPTDGETRADPERIAVQPC